MIPGDAHLGLKAASSSGRPDLGLELALQDLLRALGAQCGDFSS